MSSNCILEFTNLSASFGSKTCFEEASARVHNGDRIALVGNNGSGKSTLLKKLITINSGVCISYLPQDVTLDGTRSVWDVATDPIRQNLEDLKLLTDPIYYEAALERLNVSQGFDAESRVRALLYRFDLAFPDRLVASLSGGERMRLSWVRLLVNQPDVLLLDEPTNHLDSERRLLLMTFLHEWQGAAIIASHDVDLLELWPTTIWSLQHQRLNSFKGTYSQFLQEQQTAIEAEKMAFQELKEKRKQLAFDIQQEETRSARAAASGKKRYANDPIVRHSKRDRAEGAMSRSKGRYDEKEEAITQYRERRQPRIVVPRFHFFIDSRAQGFIEIVSGAIGFHSQWLVKDINLVLHSGQRLGLLGANGSGKTTLMRALLEDGEVCRLGEWRVPPRERIGYLDQHYNILDRKISVDENLKRARPDWSLEERRHHLGAFLFLDHNSHVQLVGYLSEGEKSRLALALIAANPPDVLLLDEVTNNLDISTKNYLAAALKSYPGTLVVNSHEKKLLDDIGVSQFLCF